MTETVLGALIGLAIALVLIAVFAVIFQWLWNTTMPDVFGVKTLNFWQAIKILILAGILFGGHRVVQMQPPVDLESPAADTSAVEQTAETSVAFSVSPQTAVRA
jgi:hypothetical protein